MKKIKLFEYLCTFDKEEWKRFGKFLNSPYHNSGRDFNTLYRLLHKYFPELNEKKLNTEYVFSKLYPGDKFDKNRSSLTIRVLYSQLMNMAEKFMMIDRFLNSEACKNKRELIYTESLTDRGLYEKAIKVSSGLYEKLQKDFKSGENIYDLLEAGAATAKINMLMAKGNQNYRIYKNEYSYLIALYFEKLGRILNNHSNLVQRFNADPGGLDFLHKLVNDFDPGYFSSQVEGDEHGSMEYAVFLFDLCKSRISPQDEIHYNSALNYFYNNFSKISPQNRFALFTRLYNICRLKSFKIDYIKYSMVAHRLSDFMIKNDYYSEIQHEKMNMQTFDALFDFKYTVLSPAELKMFIDNSLINIKEDICETVRLFAYAFYYFKTKEFSKTLEFIAPISLRELPNKHKILKLKIAALFELKMYEEALAAIESFEKYFNKDRKVNETKKDLSINFLNAVKMMINLELGGKEKEKYNLIKLLKKNRNTFWAEWLAEKAEHIYE